MTPYQLHALYCIAFGEWPRTGIDPAETRDLTEDGLIRLNEEDRYIVTAKGEAHIHQLCRLPLPQEAWMDHNGKLL